MIAFLSLLLLTAGWAHDCHYSFTVWNTRTRSSEGPFLVKKWKKDLTSIEKGPFGCTICEEDQRKVTLKNGLSFQVCHLVSGTIARILESSEFPLETVLGYRPSKSRGPLDERGLRTEFSNHAYGVAIDINENFNGLYENCVQWNPSCLIRKGGQYRPGIDPRSITPDSNLVSAFREKGFLWGGEIQSLQKDFMHFSPDGF